MAIRFDEIELTSDSNHQYPTLTNGGGNGLRIKSATGYGDFGSGNTSYFHISTDRGTFYVSKPVVFDGNINLFDTKSHFVQETDGFSMPNLISVKRLKDVLEDDSKTLSYVFIDYKRENGNVLIEDIHIKYIWELDWSILSIGALGKGQLQIKDANKELIFTDMGKDAWFEILKTKVMEFYTKQIIKIEKEMKLWE